MSAIYEPKGAAREYAALACNLYRGCTHGCTYCYAPGCLRMSAEKFHEVSNLRPGILSSLSKDARKYAPLNTPVLFCFTSDPYQPQDNEPTREALHIMNEYQCRFDILTKGGTRALRDIDLYFEGCSFGTTLSYTRDTYRKIFEPGTAPVDDRIEALRQFKLAGVRTWISIEPVIYPDQAISVIEQLTPYCDEFRVGKLNHVANPVGDQNYGVVAKGIHRALVASGKDYVIKKSLAGYLPEGYKLRERDT